MLQPLSQQRLISIKISLLKNLRDVTVSFEKERPLTAILGPNGFGKSTILHIIAASFRPAQVIKGHVSSKQGDDYRYVNFFPNTPYGSWDNSELTIRHFARRGEKTDEPSLNVGKRAQGRWYPQTKGKPEREVYYFGVANGMPEIERERVFTKVHFHQTRELEDPQSKAILVKVGRVLNRTYDLSQSNKTRKGRELIGVRYDSTNYSALSMGAGEQRLFRLFKVLEEAGKYALVLIDELDLLLHTDALHRLLEELNSYAIAKHLQIIFTTHRESVADLKFSPYVAVRHLYHNPAIRYRTFCFNDTTPDALHRLTGEVHRPLQIWCEDKVAKRIIRKVARQEGFGHLVECTRFGSTTNCYTIAAALVLQAEAWEAEHPGQDHLAQTILILDGDKAELSKTPERLIKIALDGNEGGPGGLAEQRRGRALKLIRVLIPPEPVNPEEMLHRLVKSITLTGEAEIDEVINAALSEAGEPDSKTRIQNWTNRLGDGWEASLARIIDVAARATGWEQYTVQVREWLSKHHGLLEIEPNQKI